MVRENCSQDSSHLENDQKATLRPSWVHTTSKDLREPRETESKLQTRNSDPNSSESRNWPKEELERSVDLRVDGIPNDEKLAKTSSTCKELQNKFKNL